MEQLQFQLDEANKQCEAVEAAARMELGEQHAAEKAAAEADSAGCSQAEEDMAHSQRRAEDQTVVVRDDGDQTSDPSLAIRLTRELRAHPETAGTPISTRAVRAALWKPPSFTGWPADGRSTTKHTMLQRAPLHWCIRPREPVQPFRSIHKCSFSSAVQLDGMSEPLVVHSHGLLCQHDWCIGSLHQILAQVHCHVLVSPVNLFRYYIPQLTPPTYPVSCISQQLSFSGFQALRRSLEPPMGCYLQVPLMVCHDYTADHLTPAPGLPEATVKALERAAEQAAPLQQLAGLGPWVRTQLFVSDAGALSPLHFDQYANLYIQLAGTKRVARCSGLIYSNSGLARVQVWLGHPEFSATACGYPTNHPLGLAFYQVVAAEG